MNNNIEYLLYEKRKFKIFFPENLVYLFTCKKIAQLVQKIFNQGSRTIDVPTEIIWGKKIKQELFKALFADVKQKVENDWEGTLIDQGKHVKKFVKTEYFCQHEVDRIKINWFMSTKCLFLIVFLIKLSLSLLLSPKIYLFIYSKKII